VHSVSAVGLGRTFSEFFLTWFFAASLDNMYSQTESTPESDLHVARAKHGHATGTAKHGQEPHLCHQWIMQMVVSHGGMTSLVVAVQAALFGSVTLYAFGTMLLALKIRPPQTDSSSGFTTDAPSSRHRLCWWIFMLHQHFGGFVRFLHMHRPLGLKILFSA